MPNFVPQIRVFLASPGDVNEERAVVLQVLDMLEYDPLFRKEGTGGVSIHAVAWDKPGGDAPMRATMTPQTAIRQGLPSPSECDIVLVLFWSRMGTPLPFPEYQKTDGSVYLSGTEWEFRDAFDAERENGKPITLIYRRTEEPKIDLKNRDAFEQYHKVLGFFDQFRDASTGALLGGFNEYENPEDLRQKLITHLRMLLHELLSDVSLLIADAPTAGFEEAPPLWEGSPFPGLRPFYEADAPIFFGRGLEVAQLVKVIEANRFAAVVAASGSGKSSLVAAGLIPRLKANAIVSDKVGSADWRFARFTPDEADNPLEALFHALTKAFPEHAVSPFMIEQEKDAFISSITKNPKALISICDALVAEAKAPQWTEILLFIDQFEELFTLASPTDREVLVSVLDAVNNSTRLRCVITMRSDFYANCLELPVLAELLKSGTYPLTVPTAGALVEMIKYPADRAGLTWDDGLPEKIQSDTGTGAGALALMAYALDELYHLAGDAKTLTYDDYNSLGGVEGAIGKRAENTFSELELDNKDHILQHVFRELVTVDERGTATRQRANLNRFNEHQKLLISAVVNARLLTANVVGTPFLVSEDGQKPVPTHNPHATVEVAHEAIFRSWERLKDWIASAQEDLILLRQVRTAAAEWHKRGEDYLRWNHERLSLVYAMQGRLHPELTDIEQQFIEPEQARLICELETLPKDATSHERRRDIGDRLAVIGDPRKGVGVVDGLPDMDWIEVKGSDGQYTFEFGEFEVPDFYISKYLVTYPQYQVFADSDYDNLLWWEGFPERYQLQKLGDQRTKIANTPRDNISWYQSVAFSRWLDAKLRDAGLLPDDGLEVRLSTEWEWQWVAMNGLDTYDYPCGEWQEGYVNTFEAGLSRTTAVGMYPHGQSVSGALDMSGNLWEWCLNDYGNPDVMDGYGNKESKVLRGGSFANNHHNACASSRNNNLPFYANFNYGCRLVVSRPLG